MNGDRFRRIVREYFAFSRSERTGFSVLAVFLMLSVVFSMVSEKIIPVSVADFEEVKKMIALMKESREMAVPGRSLFHFDPNVVTEESLDSLDIPRAIAQNLIRYRSRGGTFRSAADVRRLYGMNDSIFSVIEPWISIRPVRVFQKAEDSSMPVTEYFFFDPNNSGDDDLKLLGLNDYQRRNLLAYRERGGRFRSADDLGKIYGMDEALIHRLKPWIFIPEEEVPAAEVNPGTEAPVVRIVELNTADSISLTGIPGIGPVFAGRILKYRLVLGGFFTPEQLGEVFGISPERLEQIRPFISADADRISKIRINFAERDELRRHPYITPDMASLIIKSRSQDGPFKEEIELISRGIMDEARYGSVSHYFTVR